MSDDILKMIHLLVVEDDIKNRHETANKLIDSLEYESNESTLWKVRTPSFLQKA